MTSLVNLPLDQIETGERTRQEFRNLDSLARSIRERGLLSPVNVRLVGGGRKVLICGGRRLQAVRSLGWSEIPALIADDDMDELEALLAEGEENTEREPFTPAEAVRHRQRIREVESRRAKERQGTRTDLHPSTSSQLGKKSTETRTAHRTARATGYGATTLDKAEEIVAAAQSPETPEPVRQVAQRSAAALEQPGTKVDREYRAFREEVAKTNPDVAEANYRKALTAALVRAGQITAYEPERVAQVADDSLLWTIAETCEQIADWHEQIKTQRSSGLRIVNGGQ